MQELYFKYPLPTIRIIRIVDYNTNKLLHQHHHQRHNRRHSLYKKYLFAGRKGAKDSGDNYATEKEHRHVGTPGFIGYKE